MTFRASFPLIPLAVAGGLAAALGACTPDRATVPPYYADLARVDAQVDAATAAQMISSYRQSNGKPPLTVDPALMQAARKQAVAMAEAGDVRASLQPTKPKQPGSTSQTQRTRDAASSLTKRQHWLPSIQWPSPPARA